MAIFLTLNEEDHRSSRQFSLILFYIIWRLCKYFVLSNNGYKCLIIIYRSNMHTRYLYPWVFPFIPRATTKIAALWFDKYNYYSTIINLLRSIGFHKFANRQYYMFMCVKFDIEYLHTFILSIMKCLIKYNLLCLRNRISI